jgi:hypothetical protein
MNAEFRDPLIYLIGGKARHGKSTTARIIKDEYEKMGKNVAITSYGKYIKDYARNYFGWDGREETKPRDLLQFLGTDIIRGKLKKHDFFVNRMIDDIQILSYFFDVIVIDDARLEIEVEKPKMQFEKFIAVKIIRDNFDNGLTAEQKHDLTEIDFDDYNKFDYCIHNDGTTDELRNKVIAIINKEDFYEKNE